MDVQSQTIINFIEEFAVEANSHRTTRLNNSETQLEEIFTKQMEIKDKIAADNRKSSFLFCIFDLFKINENKMSEILAFLFDQNKTHGQGNTYLKEFCRFFNINVTNFDNPLIACEASTDQSRRIDILIKIGEYYIIIENKYRYALNQVNQLSDYYDFIKRQISKLPEDKIYLIYLTPYGKMPEDETIDQKLRDELINSRRLLNISFHKTTGCDFILTDYLRNCIDISANYKMKFIIKELIDHIEEENKMDTYQDEIFNWLSSNSDRLKNAQQISEGFYLYKEKLLKKTVMQLKQSLELNLSYSNCWSVETDDNINRVDTGINIYNCKWSKKYYIQFAGGDKCFNDLYIAFQKHHSPYIEKEKEIGDKIKLKLSGNVDGNEGEAIWWKSIETHRYTTNENDFSQLADDKRGSVIEAWTDEVIELVKHLETMNNDLIDFSELIKNNC